MSANNDGGDAQRRIVLLATGGTIAGLSVGSGGPDYIAAQLSVGDLLSRVHGGHGLPVEAEQVAQIDSKDITHAIWHALATRCAHHLSRPEVAGIVITHGSDTMEETAYFLQHVLAPGKVVVLTGAMRPADAPQPDGPANVKDALAVAAHPHLRGVVVVMAGVVHAARWVRKVHPSRLDAFSSGEHAPVARVHEGCVDSTGVLDARPSVAFTAVPLPPPDAWPRVDIVVSHAGADGRVLDACITAGAHGIVIAATGNATVHVQLEAAAERAMRRGVLVVRATRCTEGDLNPIETSAMHPTPWVHHASPVKARIDLMLRLMGLGGSGTGLQRID